MTAVSTMTAVWESCCCSLWLRTWSPLRPGRAGVKKREVEVMKLELIQRILAVSGLTDGVGLGRK